MMKFPVRKVIPLLVFVLSILSILRLLKISITTSSSSPTALPPQTLQPKVQSNSQTKTFVNPSIITEKEFKLLSDVIASKSPCNVLLFGSDPQYLNLSLINPGGITFILEDAPEKTITSTKVKYPNNTRIYRVKYYEMEAKRAYKLLKHARDNPSCAPNAEPLQNSKCKLALRDLPQEVYEIRWDVIVVDGPRGDELEAPARMGTIYTAGALARAGIGNNKTSDVLVHDVNRTVEKWFSWEFLCEENLVSSRGNLWRFRIKSQSNSSTFCSPEKFPIQQ